MQGARVRANGLEFSGEDDFDTGCRVWVGDLAHRPNNPPPLPKPPPQMFFFRLQLLCTWKYIYFGQMCVRRRLYKTFFWRRQGRGHFRVYLSGGHGIYCSPLWTKSKWGNGEWSGERKSGWQDNSQPLAQSTTRCVCDFGAFVRVQRLNWG